MKLRYLGHSCFEITTAKGVKIVTDPYQGVGYELEKGLQADIVTLSHGHFDHNYAAGVRAPIVIENLDGYRNGEITIEGVACYHDERQGALRGKNIAYKISADGFTVCHMGDIGEECSQSLVERLGKIDILLIPVGGTYTVDAGGAKKYADALQPKVLIPMHYKPLDGSLDITGIEPFLRLYERGEITPIPSGVLNLDGKTKGIFYMERVK